MVQRREHEPEPERVDRLRDPLRRLLEREPERLEHVRGARDRADRAVPVLGDRRARRRRHDRRGRRDVERARRRRRRFPRRRRRRLASAGTGSTCARIASAQPAISSAVSPFARSATRKPPICAGVASPPMISPITSRASSRERSWPSSSCWIARWIIRRQPGGSRRRGEPRRPRRCTGRSRRAGARCPPTRTRAPRRGARRRGAARARPDRRYAPSACA